MISKVAPELKRRSKSYGDLKLKRTFDLYKQEQEHTSSITTAPHIRRRRHSSFSDYKYDLISFQQQQQYNNSDSTLQKDTKTITLHESFLPKKLENKIKYNEVVEQSKILPTMELPTTTTTTTVTAKQRSKGIVSAIIDAAKCPEKESLGWVGIEEQHENDIHDTASITLSATPPPPPPIENDTHIFDLLSKDSTYFIHYSKKHDNLTSSMNSATVEKLVEIITKDIDTDLLMDFFLTFRQFLTPIKLCKLLILRFRWALLNNDDDRRLVRIRTFVVIRYWLTHYWEHDFMTSRTLRFMLCTFLSQLRSHPTILNSPRDENIIRNLRNVLKRQRKLYCSQLDHSVTRTTTTTTNNTNNINPPPPPIILDNRQNYLYNKHPLISETNWQWQSSTYNELQLQGNNNKNNNSNNHKIPLEILNGQRKYRQGTSKSDGDIDNQLFRQWKEVRTSTSSSSLPFIGSRRARRHSTCSQRSVYSENAWSAKMNFNIKKIKRSVPTVYQSILQGMSATPPHPSSADYFQQQQQQPYDFISEKCLCEKKIKNNNNNQRYRSLSNRSTPSLMKSASRFFDFKKTTSSKTKKQIVTTTTSPLHLTTCPYYTTELSATTNDNIYPSTSTSSSSAMEGAPSLSSSSSSSTTTTTTNINHQRYKSYSSSIKNNNHYHLQQQHRHLLPRASFYSDVPPPSITIGTDVPLLLRMDYKSFILHYRSEIIAQQFCIMEQKMLQLVTWNELAELRWRKKSKGKVISPDVDSDIIRDGVEQLIGFFNKTCQWVASEIVRTRNMDTRVRVIEKFIRIALKCYHHRNYSTLMQMLLGLQSPAVSRLEKTWQRVDHYEMQIFGELKELAKPFRNWKNIRDAMTKATEDISESSAVDSILIKKRHQRLLLQQQHHHHHLSTDSPIPFLSCSPDSISGCIPFLGLYLSDLVFNAELPTYIDTSKLENREPFGDTFEDKELCKRLGTHLVNYNKFRITASIIKHILAFQVLCRTYHFDYHEEIAMNLKKMQLLDNSEIRKQSSLCEHGSL